MRTQLTFAITSRLVILDLKPLLSMTLCYSNSSRPSISQIGWQCKRPHLRVGTLPPTSGEVVLPLYLLSSWLRAYHYLTLAPFPVQQLFRSYLVPQLVKNPSAMQGLGFNPWVGRIPWRRERLPTPVFWPGEFHGLYSPWAHKVSVMTERLSLHHIDLDHFYSSSSEMRWSL